MSETCARACKFQQVEHMMHCNKRALSKKQSSFLVPVDVPLFDGGLFQAPVFAVPAFHGITAVDGILVVLVVH